RSSWLSAAGKIMSCCLPRLSRRRSAPGSGRRAPYPASGCATAKAATSRRSSRRAASITSRAAAETGREGDIFAFLGVSSPDVDPKSLKSLLEAAAAGSTGVDAALERLRELPFKDLGYANVDHHRALRLGIPEIVFGSGKSYEQIEGIVQE